MKSKKMIIAGGSGFLGRTLARWFSAREYEIVCLTRHEKSSGDFRPVVWDAKTIDSWARELESAQVLINLAGRSVNCRYNAANRKAMIDSRVLSTRVLAEAVNQCKNPPASWMNAGTATIYKHTFGDPHEEDGETGATPEAKDDYSVQVARAWEAAFDEAEVPDTRKLLLRIAMVFGNEPGGVYEVLRGLTQKGLGGKMGHGRQFVSWIHADDFCRIIEWLIEQDPANGMYNLAAPNPIPNAEMMALFREVLDKKVGLPAPKWLLEIGAFFLRTETELVIKSRRVVPGRLLKEHFEFLYSDLKKAIIDLESKDIKK